MALQFSVGALSGSSIDLSVYGDGTSTTLLVDLTKPPINMNIGGNPPTNARSFTAGVSASVSGHLLTLAFDSAPPTFPSFTGASVAIVFS